MTVPIGVKQQSASLTIKRLGVCDYASVWRRMQAFTESRNADANDELWLLEHEPVFTLGMNGKPEHVLARGDIPVLPVDRGGQVTYHAPGQMVAYILVDLRRLGIGVRQLVEALEQSVIDCLAAWHVTAQARPDAPGVYVDGAKIAALGLRVRRGCSYHGLAFNVDMDLDPFSGINPCGYEGMAVTQLRDLGIELSVGQVSEIWWPYLASQLGFSLHELTDVR